MKNITVAFFLSGTLGMAFCLHAADWPAWGRNQSRNMVSYETDIVTDFDPGQILNDESVDLNTSENIKWVAKLGSQAYGNVTIGEGKVMVGTNNESPRDSLKQGDRGVVMCFEEQTGEFLWQLVIPKL